MTLDREHTPNEQAPSRDDHDTPEIEVDQTVAPRPEEEIADVLRSEPDFEGEGTTSE